MKIRKIGEYYADKGSVVINGVSFGNGVGDGGYDILYSDSLPDGFNTVGDIFIDLRDTVIEIPHSDCELGKNILTIYNEIEPDKDAKNIRKVDAKAVQIAFNDSGDVCLVGYF